MIIAVISDSPSQVSHSELHCAQNSKNLWLFHRNAAFSSKLYNQVAVDAFSNWSVFLLLLVIILLKVWLDYRMSASLELEAFEISSTRVWRILKDKFSLPIAIWKIFHQSTHFRQNPNPNISQTSFRLLLKIAIMTKKYSKFILLPKLQQLFLLQNPPIVQIVLKNLWKYSIHLNELLIPKPLRSSRLFIPSALLLSNLKMNKVATCGSSNCSLHPFH